MKKMKIVGMYIYMYVCVCMYISTGFSVAFSYGMTFLVKNEDEKYHSCYFGHCISFASRDELYRWMSALLIAQVWIMRCCHLYYLHVFSSLPAVYIIVFFYCWNL